MILSMKTKLIRFSTFEDSIQSGTLLVQGLTRKVVAWAVKKQKSHRHCLRGKISGPPFAILIIVTPIISGTFKLAMPPPSKSPALHLQILSESFFIVQFQPGQEIGLSVLKDLTEGKGGFFSVTRTRDEISLVGEAYEGMPSSYEEHSTWMCIKIEGPMEHSK